MIVRHDLIEAERIEQLPLILLEPTHHRSPSSIAALTPGNQRSSAPASDSCNKICQKQTNEVDVAIGRSMPTQFAELTRGAVLCSAWTRAKTSVRLSTRPSDIPQSSQKSLRLDVLVHPEEVGWVVFLLQRG